VVRHHVTAIKQTQKHAHNYTKQSTGTKVSFYEVYHILYFECQVYVIQLG